jgi:phasin
MLLLLLKSFWWTTWWPYSTWLLAMEKAMRQTGQDFRPPWQPQAYDKGQVRPEERTMANDAFMKPEIPEALRDIMRMSIEQAKMAFDTFAVNSEKAWRQLQSSSQSTRAGLLALNEKVAEITRKNAEANFTLAMRLAESKDVNQAMELQTEHARKQMEAFVHQLEEMRDLAAQIIQEGSTAVAAAGQQAAQEMASAATRAAATAPSYTSTGYSSGGGS